MKFRHYLATALLAVACHSQAGIVYGSNLVVNGDAESGTLGWTGYSSYSNIQSVNYGNNWVKPTEPGPVDRGASMFTGLGAYAVGYQTLEFGMALTQAIAYELTGWLGGWASQGDNALFYAQFLDEFDNELGGAAIGPVSAADRGNTTGLFFRETDGYIPVGTSKVSFWLSMERIGGGDNDGYADNLAFVLAAPPINHVPEPGSLALLLLGLGVLEWSRRRVS